MMFPCLLDGIDDYIACHLSALQRAGQSYVLVYTASTEPQMGQRTPEDGLNGSKEKRWKIGVTALAAVSAFLVGFWALKVYL